MVFDLDVEERVIDLKIDQYFSWYHPASKVLLKEALKEMRMRCIY